MPDDDLTATDEQVRRLLADARHTEPMPEDVAARLDGVLAGLREEQVEVPASRPERTRADEIAAARRRRTVRNWLVAAAAVVVVGVGINQVEWSGMSSGDDAGAGGDSTAAEAAPNEDSAEAPNAATDRREAAWQAARLQLTADRFGAQVERFRGGAAELSSEAPRSEAADQHFLTDGDGAAAYSVMCDVGDLGPGHLVPVRYDGRRAWLVFRTPVGETQVVDLYLCGSNEPTRSITLPAP